MFHLQVSVIQTRALLKSSLKYRDNPKEAFRQTPLIRQLLRTKLRGNCIVKISLSLYIRCLLITVNRAGRSWRG